MSEKSELPVLLIVEDDEGLQRQLKWAYEGYRVVSANDRAQAIEMVRLHEPSVVTLDLGLPPRGERVRAHSLDLVDRSLEADPQGSPIDLHHGVVSMRAPDVRHVSATTISRSGFKCTYDDGG